MWSPPPGQPATAGQSASLLMGARAINAGIGLWLFLSPFLWEQFGNAWIVMWSRGAGNTFWNHPVMGATLSLFALLLSAPALRGRSVPTSV